MSVYTDYLNDLNNCLLQGGIRLPIDLTGDYSSLCASVSILEQYLEFNKVLQVVDSEQKIDTLFKTSQYLYVDIIKFDVYKKYKDTLQEIEDNLYTELPDPLQQKKDTTTSVADVSFFNKFLDMSVEKHRRKERDFEALNISMGIPSEPLEEPTEYEQVDDEDEYEDFGTQARESKEVFYDTYDFNVSELNRGSNDIYDFNIQDIEQDVTEFDVYTFKVSDLKLEDTSFETYDFIISDIVSEEGNFETFNFVVSDLEASQENSGLDSYVDEYDEYEEYNNDEDLSTNEDFVDDTNNDFQGAKYNSVSDADFDIYDFVINKDGTISSSEPEIAYDTYDFTFDKDGNVFDSNGNMIGGEPSGGSDDEYDEEEYVDEESDILDGDNTNDNSNERDSNDEYDEYDEEEVEEEQSNEEYDEYDEYEEDVIEGDVSQPQFSQPVTEVAPKVDTSKDIDVKMADTLADLTTKASNRLLSVFRK